MTHFDKILISSCLLGEKVRYDGGHNLIDDPRLQALVKDRRLVPVCPECEGGLPVPRPPCERDAYSGKIMTREGIDQTFAFQKGAEATLDLVRHLGIKVALMKEGSPSCGVYQIHDGTFSKSKMPGNGLTTGLLMTAGVRVFSENQLEEFFAALGKTP